MNNITNKLTFFDLVKLFLFAILIPNILIHGSAKHLISLEWRSLIIQIIMTIMILVIFKKKLLITKQWSDGDISYFSLKELLISNGKIVRIYFFICLIWPILYILALFDPSLFEKIAIANGEAYGDLKVVFYLIIADLVRRIFAAVFGFEVMFNYTCKHSKIAAILIGTLLNINIALMPLSFIGHVLMIIIDIIPPFLLTLIYSSSRNLILILFLIFIRWTFYSLMVIDIYLHFK